MSFKTKNKVKITKAQTVPSLHFQKKEKEGDNTNVEIFLNFELKKVVEQTTINNQPIIIK